MIKVMCESDLKWYCLVCNIKNNLDRMPFTRCDNNELLNIISTNSMKFLGGLPNLELVNETSTFSAFSSNDISNELPSKSTCKYYSLSGYELFDKKQNLNIFHSNINGLGAKLEHLQEFLSRASTKLDIVAITETSGREMLVF